MMNSLRKMIAMVIVFTMISGALLIMVPQAGESSVTNELPYADQIPIYADETMRNRGAEEFSTKFLDLSEISPLVENDPLNTTKQFLATGLIWDEDREEYVDAYYFENMVKRGEGNHCEVWVASDLSFPEGDPRNDRVNITDENVTYIMSEFDNKVYPIMSDTFLDAPALNGSDPNMANWQYILNNKTKTKDDVSEFPGLFETNETGKLMIMIFNVKDWSYYHPAYTGGYVVGYYSSNMRWTYDRNIIHIDCWDWANRTGVQSDIPNSGHYSYVYESTVAHEYQHLLHYEMDGAEESWINEGLSMMSEYLCGYPLSYSHMASFMYTPDNSLTIWGDQGDINILADYGCVLMFQLFLYDNYGETEMMQAIFNSQLQGIESIDDALLNMGYNRMNFDKLFRDWRLANLALMLDNEEMLPTGVRTYKSISAWDIGQELSMTERDVNGNNIYLSSDGLPQTYTIEDDPTGIWTMDAYGTDYIYLYDLRLNILDVMSRFEFDGSDLSQEGWTFDEEYWEWVSGDGDEKDFLLTMDVDLTQPAGEEGDYLHWLNVSTFWDIEANWDFGFVQVSIDGGDTWTSLNDTGDWFTEEIDAEGMPSIEENMPGLTDWPGEMWDYQDLSFDLSAYDGMEIMVGFRYMTDWATTYTGWFINGVSVDGVEQDLLEMTPVYPEMDWMVTIYLPGNGDRSMPMLIDIPTLDLDEVGMKQLATLAGYDRMYILLSNNGNVGSWELELDYFRSGPR